MLKSMSFDYSLVKFQLSQSTEAVATLQVKIHVKIMHLFYLEVVTFQGNLGKVDAVCSKDLHLRCSYSSSALRDLNLGKYASQFRDKRIIFHCVQTKQNKN